MSFISRTSSAFIAAISLASVSQTALAQVELSDQESYVNGSLCVGEKCDSFSEYQNVLSLLGDDIRILFDDTSGSGTSNNDYGIEINGSTSSGDNYFALRDETANRPLMTFTKGAVENSFFVDDIGQVGLGTDSPSSSLTIYGDENTQEFRRASADIGFIQVDEDAGTTEYIINVDELGYRLLESPNSGPFLTPLYFQKGVRNNALVLTANDRIGLGTDNPQETLHLVGDFGESTSLMLENTGVGGIGDGRWEFVMRKADGEFAINDADTPGGDFIFTGPSDQIMGSTAISIFNPTRGARWDLETRGSDGDFALDDRRTSGAADFIFRSSITNSTDGAGLFINGKVVTNGVCNMGCDAVLDADYDLPTIEEHAEEMFAKKHLPTVGPTQTGQIDVTQKMLTMLNELEKAHIYIAELNEDKKELAQALETERQSRESILSRLEAVEARLSEK